MNRDLRTYARQTNRRLLIGFIFLLVFIGDGLIYVFYGPYAALMGLLCTVAGLVPLVLIWAMLVGVEWFVKRVDDQ